MHLLQMSDQTDLSLEEFEQENYNFEELEAIASDGNKIKFLQVLSSSRQLIEWLKLETNGTRFLSSVLIIYDFGSCRYY